MLTILRFLCNTEIQQKKYCKCVFDIYQSQIVEIYSRKN